MVTEYSFNRRQWLKSTFAGVAGLALARELVVTPALAQHEKERSAKRDELIRLSSNENPFGPSQMAVMAMMQNIEKSFRYPYADTQKLVKQMADLEGVAEENIVMGVGSGEILETYGVYLGQGKGEVVTASPGY